MSYFMDMTDSRIEKGYLDGSITPEELELLRAQLTEDSDEAIGKRMQENWDAGMGDPRTVSHDETQKAWRKIECVAAEEANRRNSPMRWLRIAAAILIPVLMFTSLDYYRRASILSSPMISISTGKGERASITLPDGTKVNLNEQSTIQYDSRSFNNNRRKVTFDGEGYFEVAQDARHPFTIDADRLSVTVLGTVFDLCARSKDSISVLSLLEGEVLITATSTGEQATLTPNNKAVLEKNTGKISTDIIGEDFEVLTSWRRRQLIFREAPISAVFSTLEDAFDVKFAFSDSLDLNDSFTGTMSDLNLDIDLTILERLYHLKAVRTDRVVTISKE